MLTLEEYYATNYSKCNLTYSFWASWKGLAYPTHSIQVIALPLQKFTFYVIWKYTPVAMKAMKWPLLINHLCCSTFDFLLCTMSTPYIFIHNVSGFGVGVFHWLGVSNQFQVVSGAVSAMMVPPSYIYVFETRSHLLTMNRFRLNETWKRMVYHLSVLAVYNSVFILYFQIPENQYAAKLKALEFDPCPTREYFMNDVFVFTDDPKLIRFVIWCYAPVLVMFFTFHTLFHVICTVYHLFVEPAQSVALQTRKNQQKFFIGIVLQTFIPQAIFSFILFMFCLDGAIHNVTQQLMNSCVIVVAIHGIFESITILLVHRAYRHAVWKLLSGRVRKQ